MLLARRLDKFDQDWNCFFWVERCVIPTHVLNVNDRIESHAVMLLTLKRTGLVMAW